MRIAVCLKEVVDTRVPFAFPVPLPGQPGPAPIRLTNLADRAALELAFQIRERAGGAGSIEAFSVCGEGEDGALVYALARGADRALRLAPDPMQASPVATALALGHHLAGGGFDLVCCGDETLDNASAVVGPLLAEILGWTQVTSVSEVREVSPARCVLVRKLERGHREVVEADMPLVATFLADAVRPRYVSRRLLDRARLTTIPVTSAADDAPGAPPRLPLWPAAEQKVAPRARIKKRFAPDANLSAGDRVKAIMAGGSQSTSAASSTLEGDPAYLTEQLHRFLKHHEFV